MNPPDPSLEPRVKGVRFANERIHFDLEDGKTISVPVEWYPRIAHARDEQRANWQIDGSQSRIRWPELDQDIELPALLHGKSHSESG